MKTRIFKLLFLLFWVSPMLTMAQSKNYEIKIKIKGYRDTTCYLGHYFGDAENFYIQDTARLNKDGEGVFSGDKPLNQGQYAITFKSKALFELVVAEDQVFSIETDTLNYDKLTKVTGSEENELFFQFRKYNREKQEEYQELAAAYKVKPDEATKQKMIAFGKEMNEHNEKFLQEKAKFLFAKIITSAQDPLIPESFRKNLVGKPDSANQVFYYYRNHYFDKLDLTDERSFRTSFVKGKIKNYLTNLTVQHDDSIAQAADLIIGLSKKNTEMRKLLIWQIMNKAELPDSPVAPDGLFQYMAKKYYAGEPTLWDTSTIRLITQRAKVTDAIIMGKKIPNMHLTDTLGRAFWLQLIPAKYMILVIYDPNCSHCKEEIPKIVKIHDQIKAQGGVVALVSGPRDDKDWRKFIREYKIQKFINGIDIHINPQTKKIEGHTDFEKQFGINAYPLILVLDKDKRIIAKRLPVSNFVDFLTFLNKQEAQKNKTSAASKASK